MYDEALMNFVFALVVGKSARGNVKGKNALTNLWDDEFWVDFFIKMAIGSRGWMHLVSAGAKRTKQHATAP